MTRIQGFPPIVSPQAQVLILGSMPGEVSLQQQQYYAHPRNAFWPVMQALFGIPVDAPYEQRRLMLQTEGVAVWDVLQHCRRTGSLDSNIEPGSIQTNDFIGFFETYPDIGSVFFNGAMAEKLYKQQVLPHLPAALKQLVYTRLPSTSPAFASLTWQEKAQAWQIVKASMIK